MGDYREFGNGFGNQTSTIYKIKMRLMIIGLRC
jgi:hypothetical protein